ncbi:MAG: type II secretion system F family protein [Candidatus Eremiobacterota bacterium]
MRPLPASPPAPGPPDLPLERGHRKVCSHDVALFTVQLAALMRANIVLPRALASLVQPGRHPLNAVISEVTREIDAGGSLSDAMGKFPRVFGQTYVGMVRVGEHSGALIDILGSLGGFLRHSEDRRRHLASSLIYPAFVLGSALTMAAFLAFYMLPRFLEITEQHGGELPWLTRVVTYVWNPWSGGCLALFALLTGLWWRRVGPTPAGRQMVSRLRFETPGVGPVLQLDAMNRLCHLLAVMLRAGIPVHSAFRLLLREGTGYCRLDQALQDAVAQMVDGKPTSASMKVSEVFPPLLVGMVAIGEASGRLDQMLEKYAEIGRQDLEFRVESLLRLIEPMVLVALGGIVGTLVLAAFLPMYRLFGTLPA